MRKRIRVIVVAIAFLLLAGVALGVGRTHVASASGLSPVVQAQHSQPVSSNKVTQDNGTTVNETKNEPANSSETAGLAEDKAQNLPGGGHQDQGQVDHQFEGNE